MIDWNDKALKIKKEDYILISRNLQGAEILPDTHILLFIYIWSFEEFVQKIYIRVFRTIQKKIYGIVMKLFLKNAKITIAIQHFDVGGEYLW